MSKRGIEWAKPEEPSFLKKLKSKIGYKEKFDLKNEKCERATRDDGKDLDDEQPVIVVDDSSTVTEQDIQEYKESVKFENEVIQTERMSSKIVFRKPNKDKDSTSGLQTVQSTSKKTISTNESLKSNEIDKSKSSKDKLKPIKNKQLLSFGEEDEE